jgi:pimeloyl-ACP methyl ester carboxylesterase
MQLAGMSLQYFRSQTPSSNSRRQQSTRQTAKSPAMQERTSMNNQDELRHRYLMNRRAFLGTAAAGAASPLLARGAAAQPAPKAQNVVLVHGLFADGSCWSEVIARLQSKGINVTAVQNPLTSLGDAVEATQRVLALQDGPTALVAHSFGGMIVTEAGVDPKVSAVVYIAARARPMRARITQRWPSNFRHRPPLPGSSGPAMKGGWARKPSCATSPATYPQTKPASSTRSRRPSNERCSPTKQPTPRGDRSRAGMPCRRKTALSIRISSGLWLSAWAQRRSR